jgi:hypothetical protein
MQGPLHRYLSDDHDRLDRLLDRTVAVPGMITMEAYADFRKGLLRHIAMEEKIVLPAIAQLQGGRQADVAERLRLDHGALVALLVPPPSSSIILTIRSILAVHNALEEHEGGMYQLFERLAGQESGKFLAQLIAAPEVPVVPHNDRPGVLEATQRAVARAGYEFITGSGTS